MKEEEDRETKNTTKREKRVAGVKPFRGRTHRSTCVWQEARGKKERTTLTGTGP